MNSYTSERQQRTKLDVHYSSWKEILFGVPDRSILGVLLFNIFLCDLFVPLKDIDFTNYAADDFLYTKHDSIDQIISRLEKTTESLFKWFSDNQMKADSDKCHLLLNDSCKRKLKQENLRMKAVHKKSYQGLHLTLTCSLQFT